MNKTRTSPSRVFEQVLPWGVLVMLLFFTYMKFFQHPYAGFRWDSNGQVIFVFTDGKSNQPAVKPEEALLLKNDRLLQADSVRWADYKQDLRKPFIDFPQAGQIVTLQVERNGQQITIPWTIPGPNAGEINDLIWNEGWLALVFWFMGALTFLNIRPRNERWKLLVAFNFLTATWLMVGSGSSILHIWESAIILRVFVWLCIPVYLHLNWVFPQPLGRLSPKIIWSAYLLAAGSVVAQIFQLIPQNFYYLGFLFSIAGSLILLLVHAFRQPGTRTDLRTLLVVAFFSFAPYILIGLLELFVTLPIGSRGLGLVSLPLLPLAYFYATLRRQLGELELRFNQALSAYIYTILLIMGLLPFILLADLLITGPGSELLTGITVLIISVPVTIFGYRRLQTYVERLVFGMSLPPRDLLELYSERITTSTSSANLQTILEDEILPRLHIKQFVFLETEQGSPQVLHSVGIQAKDLPTLKTLTLSGPQAGKYRPTEASETGDPFAWVRLSIELKIGSELVGLWLFGRRDPDDFYSQMEIALIQLLANQTAIAMSNILQTQHVMEMYQQDIGQHEEYRLRLALDLHDSILNQLAALLMNLDDNAISPRFQSDYDDLTDRLREIVSDLRPPMLNYGLKPALDELTEGLSDRHETLSILTEVESNGSRYDPKVEQHIFRIAQEACENAIRHGQATKISITGYLRHQEISLQIEDNGVGFDGEKGTTLANLLAKKHFGLAGMMERARLIGGEVKIHSNPTAGTQIQIIWKSSDALG